MSACNNRLTPPTPPPPPPPPPLPPPALQPVQPAPSANQHEVARVEERSHSRANVVLELINSERDYVKHLKNVVEGYLHRARKHPEIFSAQQINTIFANIEQLYEFQRKFLGDLEQCINWQNLAQSQVGRLFLRYEKGFSVYHYYCNNHPNATSELQDLYSKPLFRAFFEECRLKQNMIDISLDGFLLTPIQRICKYPLQLNELLKNTSATHADHDDVSGALETMRNCANLANERKRRIEALADVMSFQEKFDQWIGPKLSDTCSILVHSGEVSKMTSKSAWSQGLQLHLFDHLLLYSKRDLLKRNNLILKGRISLDSVTEISDADEYKPRKSFKLYCEEQQRWFVFATKTERDRDEWMRAFERERNLVDADEAEGFHITDRELGIARRALIHRKRSRSARYRQHHLSGGGGGGGGLHDKRPDTTVTDQLDLDDSNLMMNRTLSLPSCIHPSHVMNFVEDSRVVSSSGATTTTTTTAAASAAHANPSTHKKNASSSPGSNARNLPMASASQQQLAVGAHSEIPGEHGPTSWLRKMGSKKLTRAQVYQINGQTGQQQQQQQNQHSQQQQQQQQVAGGGFSFTLTRDECEPPARDLDATALKYDELEKRHREHMVSEQQARLYRLNNDLSPPPAALYPARSLTPTFFSSPGGGGGVGGGGQPPPTQPTSQSVISSRTGGGGGAIPRANNNRPKSSPSHHMHSAAAGPPRAPHTSLERPGPSARALYPRDPRNESSPSLAEPNGRSLEGRLKESLSLGQPNGQQAAAASAGAGAHSPSQGTFETELVLSSGRVVHVREDAV